MSHPLAVSWIIPVWNEEGNIGPLLDRQMELADELGLSSEWIVVDAGSKDGTVTEAESRGERVRVVVQSEPGYGGALREGFRLGAGEWVVTCDGDGSHDPGYLRGTLPPEEGCDVVVLSRYVPGGGADQPRYRRFLSWVVNGVFRVLFRVPVRDQSSGFRIYRGDVIRDLTFDSVNFDVLEEILVLLHRGGARMKEVPFVFKDRAEGESKVAGDLFVGSYLRTVMRLGRRRTASTSAGS